MSEDSGFGMADKVEAEVVRNGDVIREGKMDAINIQELIEKLQGIVREDVRNATLPCSIRSGDEEYILEKHEIEIRESEQVAIKFLKTRLRIGWG